MGACSRITTYMKAGSLEQPRPRVGFCGPHRLLSWVGVAGPASSAHLGRVVHQAVKMRKQP